MINVYKYLESIILSKILNGDFQKVLDFGCGKAEMLQLLSMRDFDALLFGADFFKEDDVAYSIAKFSDVKLINLKNEQNDKYGTFDFIYTIFTAHHFESIERALMMTNKLLKPGGDFLLIDYCYDLNSKIDSQVIDSISSNLSEINYGLKGQFHRHHYTKEELVYEISREGFNIENISIKTIDHERSITERLSVSHDIYSDNLVNDVSNLLVDLEKILSMLSQSSTVAIIEGKKCE